MSPPDDDEDPGMRAVLDGRYDEAFAARDRSASRSHEERVREQVAFLDAREEAQKRREAAKTGDGTDLERAGWTPIDLKPVLDGTAPIVLPTLGRRNDGIPLLYAGKEHSIASEPECGKTWFALLQVLHVLKTDGRVVYVDFEDDERTIVGRLKTMGLLPARLTADADQFRYVRPEGAHRVEWLQDLLSFKSETHADLVIYDGVTEGMQLWGLDPLNQNAAAEWRRLLIKPAMAVGAATLCTDHVVKNREARGQYAIGAQHKLAGLNGAQFLMERVDPFGRGLKGRSRVLVSKDRNGGLRQHGKPVEGAPGITYLGDLVGDAGNGEMESLIFWPPRDAEEHGEDEAPEPPAADLTKVIAQVRNVLLGKTKPQTFNDINSRVTFGASKLRQALARMEDDGSIIVADGPNRSRLHSLTPLAAVAEAA